MSGSPESLTRQQDVAAQPGALSVALSAGAGCGKTTVLTERFLRMLDPLRSQPLGKLVALTFTDKAARELRGRVRGACRGRLDSSDDEAYWRSVLRGLEAAPIGTFHAFCGQVLRRFPIESGVEPGFAVIEETIAATLRDGALADCVRSWLAGRDADFAALAVEHGIPAVQERLLRLMTARGRADLAEWSDCPPEAIVRVWESHWTRCRVAVIRDRIEPAFQPVRALCNDLAAQPALMRERLRILLDQVPALGVCDDLDGALASIREAARVERVSKKSWADESLHGRTRDALSGLRDAVDAVRKAITWDRGMTIEAARQAGQFARLTLRAIDAYTRSKREQGGLDFEDLQLKTRDLLRARPEAVRRWLERSVGFVLVDEFQDTDPIQAEVVRRLIGDGLAEGRLFLVGDSKQSIYRFRGARPEIFDEFRAELDPSGRLHLTENFRSVPPILDFVNTLFAETFVGVEHQLVPGRRLSPPSVTDAVEFVWAEATPADGADSASADDRRRTEARWLARLVRSRLGEQGWIIGDGQGGRRPARPGDVVLLFRTLKDAAPYEAALAGMGLDYHIVGGTAFFGQQEVLDVINLLATLDDPHDELALAATLRSPFGCVTDDGLYHLATSAHGALPEGFDRWSQLPCLTATDRARAGRLHGLLARWRGCKDHLPIAALLDRVLDESGYEAALPAEFLGDRRRANLRKLVRMARRFDARGELTLADFVARLRSDYRDPPREDQAATTDEQGDAVRLMTIHQAKGLEFPVVILADLNRKDPTSRDDVALHPELGIVVRGSSEPTRGPDGESDAADAAPRNLGWLIHEARERAAEQAESLRLFYVATTRARDHLVVSAGMGAGERPQSAALRLLASRYDLARGEPLVGEPGSRVGVITTEPVATPGAARSPRRPRLLTVARLIRDAAKVPVPTQVAPQAVRPRLLDLDPCRTLPPRAALCERLLSACLRDPALFDSRDGDSLVREAARRLGVLASEGTMREAGRRVGSWLSSGDAEELRTAQVVERGESWSVAWPQDDPEPCVFRGRAEFVYRNRRGEWVAVIVSSPEAPEGAECLRLLLSAVAQTHPTGTAIRHGWRSVIGLDGAISRDRRFRPDQLASLVDSLISGRPVVG
jgi:ATP-dependent helicase/nuclease subunit A